MTDLRGQYHRFFQLSAYYQDQYLTRHPDTLIYLQLKSCAVIRHPAELKYQCRHP